MIHQLKIISSPYLLYCRPRFRGGLSVWLLFNHMSLFSAKYNVNNCGGQWVARYSRFQQFFGIACELTGNRRSTESTFTQPVSHCNK
ncbi:hypothetical protein Plhal304r1_c077g0164111 [Plasmopara halstedii]